MEWGCGQGEWLAGLDNESGQGCGHGEWLGGVVWVVIRGVVSGGDDDHCNLLYGIYL